LSSPSPPALLPAPPLTPWKAKWRGSAEVFGQLGSYQRPTDRPAGWHRRCSSPQKLPPYVIRPSSAPPPCYWCWRW